MTWTQDQISMVRRMARQGRTYQEIAVVLGAPETAISVRRKARRLEIIVTPQGRAHFNNSKLSGSVK